MKEWLGPAPLVGRRLHVEATPAAPRSLRHQSSDHAYSPSPPVPSPRSQSALVPGAAFPITYPLSARHAAQPAQAAGPAAFVTTSPRTEGPAQGSGRAATTAIPRNSDD